MKPWILTGTHIVLALVLAAAVGCQRGPRSTGAANKPVVGVSLGGTTVTTFVAYGTGMTVVLMAISVLVALAREGVARAMRPLLPYLGRVSGALLTLAGGYLIYYWARLRFGDSATVADDPIVSFGVKFSGQIRNAADGSGFVVVVAAAAVVLVAAASSVRHRRVTAK